MPILRQSVRRTDPGMGEEDGFVLLMVLFLMVLLLVALAVAAPKVARSIQRDKEVELMHRGEEYKHAVKLYYKKFGAYPSSIDQLVNTNQIRFLRKRYADPITGKDDWRIIHLGEAKVPPMGFFGQPLTGLGGTATITGNPTGAPAGSSAFGTATVDTPDTSNATNDSSTPTGENAATNPSVTITGGASASSAFGTSAPGGTSAFGTSAPGGTTAGTGPFGTNTTGDNNPTLGGGPIVGVGIPPTKASLIEYKKQKHYNQWEFVYNPLEDQLAAAGMVGASTPNTNVNGTGSGISPGMANSGGFFGPSSGTQNAGPGATINPPTESNPPQQ